MKADWLCKIGGQSCGPFSIEQLRQLAAAGTIDASSEVRRQQDERWYVAGKVSGLLTPAPLSPAAKAAAARPAPAPSSSAKSEPHLSGELKPLPRAKVLNAPPRSDLPAGVAVAKPNTAASSAATIHLVTAPVGKPVDPVSILPVFTTNPTATNPNPTATKKASGSKPGKRPLLLLGSLLGVGALAVIAGGVLLALNLGSADSKESAAASTQGKASPVELVRSGKAVAMVNQVGRNADQAEGESNDCAATQSVAAALGSISSWNDLLRVRSIELKNLARFEVAAVWLAADAKGRRIEMKVPAASPAAAPTAEASTAAPVASPSPAPVALEPAEPAMYVFAEVRIKNTGRSPLKYQGWNAPTGTTAMLANVAGTALEFVAPTETPGVERLGIVFIPPGSSVSDVVVFRAPATAVQSLRLALPKVALSTRLKGFFAFEVPAEALFQLPRAAADQSGQGSFETAALRNGTQPADFDALQKQIMEFGGSGDGTPDEPIKPAQQ